MLGTGLLLGAAIGVIIPECVRRSAGFPCALYLLIRFTRGIETIYEDIESASESELSTTHAHSEPPTFAIAISLLLGFIFMLIVEQISAQLSPPPKQPSSTPPRGSLYALKPNLRRSTSGMLAPSRPLSPTTATSIADGDLDLDLDLDLELHNFADRDAGWPTHSSDGPQEGRRDPRLLTFGLVIHSLADGLALGASVSSSSKALAEKTVDGVDASSLGLSSLSLVVFVALALHKGTLVACFMQLDVLRAAILTLLSV